MVRWGVFLFVLAIIGAIARRKKWGAGKEVRTENMEWEYYFDNDEYDDLERNGNIGEHNGASVIGGPLLGQNNEASSESNDSESEHYIGY